MNNWYKTHKARVYGAAFALIPAGLFCAEYTELAVASLVVGFMEACAFVDAYRTGYLTPETEGQANV